MSIFGKKRTIDIGGFPCATYGSLLQEEEEWFEAREMQRIDHAIPVLELARTIAKDKGISEEESLTLIQSFSDPASPNAHLLVSYADQMKGLTETMKFEKGFPTAIATLAIQSRVNQSFLEEHAIDLEESFDISFKGQWREEDTRKLPVSLISELALFLIQERNGVKQESEDEEKSLGESSTTSTMRESPLEPIGKSSTPKSKKQASAIQSSTPDDSTALRAS